MSEEVIESAKAAQEIAKTAGKVVDASEKLGGFIAKYTAGSLESAMGILEDKLKFMRWERQIRLIDRADEILQKRGLNKPIKAIPLKLAIPLFEAASLEEDDYLQDLWINLLVNAADEESGMDIQRSYIDILEQLTSLEAKIMEKIYLAYPDLLIKKDMAIVTTNLPEGIMFVHNSDLPKWNKELNFDVKLALANLDRLGCLSIGKTIGGDEIFYTVKVTYLGEYFVKACSSNRAI